MRVIPKQNIGPNVLSATDLHMAGLTLLDNMRIQCVANTATGVAVFNRDLHRRFMVVQEMRTTEKFCFFTVSFIIWKPVECRSFGAILSNIFGQFFVKNLGGFFSRAYLHMVRSRIVIFKI